LYYCWKYLADEPGPIVIVCPANAKRVWQRQALQHLGLHAEVLNGETAPDEAGIRDPNQIYVLNYDILVPNRRDGKKRNLEKSWTHFLNALKPRIVIGDECHFIKSVRAARSRAFRRLCEGVERVLLLSGTPLTNNPVDLWPALNILRPREYPAFFPFAVRYSNARRMPWGWNYRGAKNLDELHANLRKTCMVRRLKIDVLRDLPEKRRSIVPVEIDRREYNAAETDFLAWLEKTAGAGRADRARKARELAKMNELRRLAGRLKVRAVIEWVRDFFEGSDEKLLLGAVHRAVTGPLMEAFRSTAVLVDGGLSELEKTEAFDKFNADERCRLLVGNVQAAGTAWSCRATSKVLLCEMPWTPGECLQFEDRVHGLERGIPGTAAEIYYLVAEDTIEADLCRVIQTKQGWLDSVLDGGTRAETELDIYDQVKALVRRRAS
jgi:SWI/SNF-related matrix-associated actin-dependent regulator 1 of chromatin subfamily A